MGLNGRVDMVVVSHTGDQGSSSGWGGNTFREEICLQTQSVRVHKLRCLQIAMGVLEILFADFS